MKSIIKEILTDLAVVSFASISVMGLVVLLAILLDTTDRYQFPKCPSYKATTTPIYEYTYSILYSDDGGLNVKKATSSEASWKTYATTTIYSYSIESMKIREDYIQGAVEYNERVDACKTLNGEF